LLPILDRLVRGSQPKSGGVLTHVLALKWDVYTKAERDELLALEDGLRSCGINNLVFDSVETGARDLVFWFHTSNPKRAFKELAKLPSIAEHTAKLHAAYAERGKLRFTQLRSK